MSAEKQWFLNTAGKSDIWIHSSYDSRQKKKFPIWKGGDRNQVPSLAHWHLRADERGKVCFLWPLADRQHSWSLVEVACSKGTRGVETGDPATNTSRSFCSPRARASLFLAVPILSWVLDSGFTQNTKAQILRPSKHMTCSILWICVPNGWWSLWTEQ